MYSDDAPWDHVLVGWTGEITKESTVRTTFKVSDLTDELKALLSASLPVPIDGKTKASNQYFGPQGVSLSTQDRKNLENLLEKQQGGRVVPVWLNDSTSDSDNFYLKDQRRWCRFSEHELYSLFHYKQNEPTDGHDVKKFWIDYYKMNKMFADRIMEVYKPGDIVIVHDHQLLLLPALLRQRIPSIFVGFFLHIPFPSSELYRCLTQRKELLEGILGANMVGFQSYSYSRHFSSCCTRILGFDSSSVGVDAYGAHVAVDVFPIGIDAQSILTAAFEDPVVDEKMASIRKLYAGKKLIVGRDRMDSIRGVAQKLQAFEMFLDNYPEWQDKVVLVQITSSSDRNPEQDASDKKYVNKIGDLVAKINGTFGSLSHAPVQHFPQYLSKEEYLALLRVADLGLITSVRDGMNTTSMEYVICQRDNHGPLILSEFSGTAGSLSDAIHVNPWDLHSVAESINRALLLSDEAKKSQHDKLYNYVTKNNIRTWTDKFINRLLTNLSSYDQSMATPVLDRARILEQYQTAKKRLFMFDYDGTLTPIVKDPLAALPSDRVLRTLKTLAGDPNNHVWIISGRDQAFLEEWMGHISPLGLSAEHGAFMRYPHEDSWINVAEGLDMSWREEVQKIFQHYTERTQGSVIEVKKIALTWHYRGADPDYATHQAHACQKELEAKVAKKWDVEVMNGKANLEVRPKVTNKGEIAKRLIEMYGIDELGLVLCLGDDYTDEGWSNVSFSSVIYTNIIRYVPLHSPLRRRRASSTTQSFPRHSRCFFKEHSRLFPPFGTSRCA